MRVLLDTNIFIYREDDHVLLENLQELLRILSEANAEVIIHPSSLEDLQKDIDEERKKIMSSKIRAYPFLKTPPNPKNDVSYLNIVGNNAGCNDEIDNIILYSVYRDAADFLITEDRGIHKKASKLGIIDRILLIDEALLLFKNYIHTDNIIAPPALKNEFVYNLKYEDPIFDTLKEEYPGFDYWFKKISREGRKSWVYYRKDRSLGAVLIYKIEDETIDANPSLPKKRRLKIATLKVADRGYKIGELFIKMSTDLAIKNGIYEIYLTHFTKPPDQLIELYVFSSPVN
jgi:predicted nucleic acid-binding protein